MAKKTKTGYVDNKKFYDEIVKHKQKVYEAEERGEEPPQISDYLGKCIMLIATNFTLTNSYLKYTYRDEMISDAIMNCIRYFNSFNEKKYKNPLAYFTEISKHACKHRINLEKREQYAKYKQFSVHMVHNGELDNDIAPDNEMYDNLAEYIEDWEKKDLEKKEKRKEKAAEKKKLQEALENDME